MEPLYTTFICLGPVPRTCLETITVDSSEKEHAQVISEYLGELNREIEQFAMSRGQILENVMSKNLSHARTNAINAGGPVVHGVCSHQRSCP